VADASLSWTADHSAMTRPAPSRRILLIADRRTQTSEAPLAPIRRYRLAKLRVESRPTAPASRFADLKRVYD
jgi:hypothetical protein